MTDDPTARVAGLSFWRGKVEPVPLGGGMTNQNFVVQDGNRRCVVRVGADVPEHNLLRFADVAASRAAARAGISPEVLHSEPGIVVLDFIEGRTLEPADIRERSMQQRIVPLLKRCHREAPRHLRGPVLAFWVFHVLRDYTSSVTLPEWQRLKVSGLGGELLRRARNWLVRRPARLDQVALDNLRQVLNDNERLRTIYELRERLALLWEGANVSNDKLLEQLKDWCCEAEASGIEALEEFAARLRGYLPQRAMVAT